MTHRFAELMFTPTVKALQAQDGSRASYARFESADFPARDRLDDAAHEFISRRDSFYLASVSEEGWPYVQHRGGPPGFLRVLDERTLGFLDYPGNRQFISFGNIATDDRVCLFLMDYPNRRRMKLLGHARPADATELARLRSESGAVEDRLPARGLIVAVEGFDWNCPKYITQRFTADELAPLRARIEELEAENAALRAGG